MSAKPPSTRSHTPICPSSRPIARRRPLGSNSTALTITGCRGTVETVAGRRVSHQDLAGVVERGDAHAVYRQRAEVCAARCGTRVSGKTAHLREGVGIEHHDAVPCDDVERRAVGCEHALGNQPVLQRIGAFSTRLRARSVEVPRGDEHPVRGLGVPARHDQRVGAGIGHEAVGDTRRAHEALHRAATISAGYDWMELRTDVLQVGGDRGRGDPVVADERARRERAVGAHRGEVVGTHDAALSAHERSCEARFLPPRPRVSTRRGRGAVLWLRASWPHVGHAAPAAAQPGAQRGCQRCRAVGSRWHRGGRARARVRWCRGRRGGWRRHAARLRRPSRGTATPAHRPPTRRPGAPRCRPAKRGDAGFAGSGPRTRAPRRRAPSRQRRVGLREELPLERCQVVVVGADPLDRALQPRARIRARMRRAHCIPHGRGRRELLVQASSGSVLVEPLGEAGPVAQQRLVRNLGDVVVHDDESARDECVERVLRGRVVVDAQRRDADAPAHVSAVLLAGEMKQDAPRRVLCFV